MNTYNWQPKDWRQLVGDNVDYRFVPNWYWDGRQLWVRRYTQRTDGQ